MSTYTSIQKSPLLRLQAQMAEHRLAIALRQRGWLSRLTRHLSDTRRRARGRVRRIRHWQDGGFVSMRLGA